MKKLYKLIPLIFLVFIITSCASNSDNRIHTYSSETITEIVKATLSAIPSITASATLTNTIIMREVNTMEPTSTNTPINSLIPLYPEISWEIVGPSDQEVVISFHTHERTTLSGTSYQATLPVEKNELTNNVHNYYLPGNLMKMGWMYVDGSMGPMSSIDEYYNNAGYFMLVKFLHEDTQSIELWISEETTIVPDLPPQPV